MSTYAKYPVGAGTGDVVGPASATDNAVARFDGATGKLLQDSVVIVGDTGNVTGVGTLAASGAISGSNLSGTNTGDVTLAAVGAVPASAGASLAGQVLTLQPADATNPGVVTTGAQTIAGAKTFSSTIVGSINGNAATVTTNANLTGPITSVGNATSIASQTGTGSTFVVDTGPTMTNPVVGTQASTDNSTKAASTAYVTSAIASAVAGVDPAIAVKVATTAASDTSGLTYSNGVAGVGATFTGSVNTAITIDGVTLTSLAQRVLVKNDTQAPSGAFNGVYYLTQIQTAILAPILTRALDYNSSSNINNTGAIPVVSGTVNAETSWLLTSSVTTVGTDALTFVQFSINPTTILTNTLTSAHLFVGNVSNVATDVALSGDSSITNAGVMTNSKVNGVAYPASPSTNTVPVVTSSNTITYETCPVNAGGSGQTSYTDGQLLIGNTTGNTLAKATITAGSGITVTNGSGSITIATSGASGNLNASFKLNGATVTYVCIDSCHYQAGTQSLTAVNISMLNSGSSGSTVIQVNQYRSGALQGSATASLSASSGNPSGAAAALSGTLSLLAGDIITVDVNSVAGGSPSELSVEY